jgi:hypothetical protein
MDIDHRNCPFVAGPKGSHKFHVYGGHDLQPRDWMENDSSAI